VGNFLNGLRSGQGILYWDNGKAAYEGQWQEGKRHGFGVNYDADGVKLYEGQWQNDEPAAAQ